MSGRGSDLNTLWVELSGYHTSIHEKSDPADRVPEESVVRRVRLDNLELLALPEDEDDLEMTDPKETLYDTYSATHKHDIARQITDFRFHSRFSLL